MCLLDRLLDCWQRATRLLLDRQYPPIESNKHARPPKDGDISRLLLAYWQELIKYVLFFLFFYFFIFLFIFLNSLNIFLSLSILFDFPYLISNPTKITKKNRDKIIINLSIILYTNNLLNLILYYLFIFLKFIYNLNLLY